MRARDKRIERVAYAIDASPVRKHLLREAYEWFTMFGELHEHVHVAYEVVQQALRGGAEAPPVEGAVLTRRVRQAAVAYQDRQRPRDEWPPTVRGLLFDEALFESQPLRNLARSVIATEVAWGGDVQNPGFAARHGVPGYGCVALHVCGYPGKLAIPPYEAEAKRLFVRLDNFRGRIPQDDPSWMDAQSEALAAFFGDSVLPDDELLLEGVLVHLGLDLLQAHRQGMDVSRAMALLDRLARNIGDEREPSLAELSELAKTGLWHAVRTGDGPRGRRPRPTPPAP